MSNYTVSCQQPVTNILQLPPEILQRILCFVPKRQNTCLVCHWMYEAFCEVRLRILKTILCPVETFREEFLPLIMNSIRKFDEIHLILPELTITKEILMKFGKNVKIVKIMMNLTLNENEFIDLIALMPNLQELHVEENFQLNRLANKSNSVLNLRSLRSINIKSRYLFEFLARSLPTNILENLNLDFDFTDDNLLENLLRRQTTTKKILMRRCYPSISIMAQLKLSQLKRECLDEAREFNYLKELLTCQRNLVHLDLTKHCMVNVDIMKVISGMANLEILRINAHIPEDALEVFSRLTKLKHFHITDCDHIHEYDLNKVFEKLSHVKLLSIHTFHVEIKEFSIPSDIYEQIGSSFKNVKHLKIACIDVTREDPRIGADEIIRRPKPIGDTYTINMFLRAFPNLESLHVYYFRSAVSQIYGISSETFPKIKRLKIEFCFDNMLCEHSHIHNIKTMFPNVQEFLIEDNITMISRHILNLDGRFAQD